MVLSIGVSPLYGSLGGGVAVGAQVGEGVKEWAFWVVPTVTRLVTLGDTLVGWWGVVYDA